MKSNLTIFVFLTLLFSTSYGQSTKDGQSGSIFGANDTIDSMDFVINDFKILPSEYATKDRAYLIDKIVPDIHYIYWECDFKDVLTIDNNRGRIIVYKGDSLKYSSAIKSINPNNGFFEECYPGICFSYIIGVHDDMKSDLIDSNAKLKKFIGHIDNIEEVILLSKINGFWFDSDTIIGGSYKERENDYLLYLLDYSSTPITFKSVKAILTKDGDFRVIDKSIYKQTDYYIIE